MIVLEKNKTQKTYSFDIFDTLITRTTANPRGIFAIMQKMLLEKDGYKSINSYVRENFYKTRIESEHFLRRHYALYNINEITFEEIYRYIQKNYSLTEAEIQTLMTLEIETELKNLLPIKTNIEKIRNLKNEGNNVILISDMYHTKDTVRSFLVQFDEIFKDITIYISSEVKETKGNKKLYEYVQKEESITVNNWTHIGDNKKGDVESSNSLGIRGQHFEYPSLYQYEIIASDRFDDDPYTQLAIGTARNVRMFQSSGQKFDLGCDMGGVILFPYINWIIEQAQKLNLNRLYFVMRDGFALKNLCDILIKNKGLNIETKLLFGSREAWRVPSISKEFSDINFMFKSPREINTVEKIASRFHIDESDVLKYLPKEFKNKTKFSKEDLNVIAEKLQNEEDFIAVVIEKNKEQRKLLIKYLQQELDFSDDKFALVDLAASGRTQNCLANIIKSFSDVKIKSFYSQFNPLKIFNPNFEMYAFYSSPRILSQMELFCRSLHGATIAYKEENGKVVPVTENIEEEALKDYGYEEVLKGEIAFVEEFCRVLDINKNIQPNLKAYLSYFDYILGKPEKLIADVIGDIPFSNYYGVEKRVYKCCPVLTKEDVLNGYDDSQIQLKNLLYIRAPKDVRELIDIKNKCGSLRKHYLHLEFRRRKKVAFARVLGKEFHFEKLFFGEKDD